MANYTKNYASSGGWQSGSAGNTPITPATLNHIEDGIANAIPQGGTFTSGATLATGKNYATAPSTDNEYNYIDGAADSSNVVRTGEYSLRMTDGRYGAVIAVRDGQGAFNQFGPLLDQSGNPDFAVSYPAALRNRLGLGDTSGALPIANGGTGATSVAGAKAALSLGTSAMNVYFAAGTASNMDFAIGSTVANSNNTAMYGKTAVLQVNNAGIGLYNLTDSAQMWTVTPSEFTKGFVASDTTWANLYNNFLSKIAAGRSANAVITADAAAVLSNNKITGTAIYATVFRSGTNNDNYTFIASNGAQYMYSWRITGATASSRTTGDVYRFGGTAL